MNSFIKYLWWKYVPGVIIKVKWPRGNIIVNDQDPKWQDMGGAVWVDLGFSADPNDHYRSWLEKNVGIQGLDWDWKMADNDCTMNQLTIKFRKKKAKYATIAQLLWN